MHSLMKGNQIPQMYRRKTWDNPYRNPLSLKVLPLAGQKVRSGKSTLDLFSKAPPHVSDKMYSKNYPYSTLCDK